MKSVQRYIEIQGILAGLMMKPDSNMELMEKLYDEQDALMMTEEVIDYLHANIRP